MLEQTKTVINPTGIHARPAMLFVNAAKKYKSKITVTSLTTNKQADAKSMLKILSLGLVCGTQVLIQADGEDEQEALDALCALIDSGMGEG